MSDYRPIDCDQHSVLEVLAMRRSRVVLDMRDDDGTVATCAGTVIDVLTRRGAEYLVLDPGPDRPGGARSIRLDRLLEIRDADGLAVWRQQSDNRD